MRVKAMRLGVLFIAMVWFTGLSPVAANPIVDTCPPPDGGGGGGDEWPLIVVIGDSVCLAVETGPSCSALIPQGNAEVSHQGSSVRIESPCPPNCPPGHEGLVVPDSQGDPILSLCLGPCSSPGMGVMLAGTAAMCIQDCAVHPGHTGAMVNDTPTCIAPCSNPVEEAGAWINGDNACEPMPWCSPPTTWTTPGQPIGTQWPFYVCYSGGGTNGVYSCTASLTGLGVGIVVAGHTWACL